MAQLLVRVRQQSGAVLVVTVAVLDLVLFSTLLNAGPRSGTPAALVVGYAAVGAGILFWQRRSPVAGYAVLWLHAVGSMVLTGYRPTLLLLVGLYSVAAQAAVRVALAALLATLAPIWLAVADGVREAPPAERLSTLAGISILLLIVHCGTYGIGRWARSVRHRAGALERGREDAAHAAVEVERTRIAHELHDIVAHSVTLMTLQAAGAKKVMRHDPGRAEEALSQVGGAGVRAMSELRRMLGGLRPADSDSLRGVDELLERVQAAGVGVTLRSEGSAVALEPAVDLAAYRIVQEALTNVAKHAGPGAHATAFLCWRPGQLGIEVTDDGNGDPAGVGVRLSTGHGLIGLAERIASLGGTVESGPAPGRGFRVSATLPLPALAPRTLAPSAPEPARSGRGHTGGGDDAAARSAG